MLKKSLDNAGNLLTSANNFPARMIIGFAKVAPEEVRSMYTKSVKVPETLRNQTTK